LKRKQANILWMISKLTLTNDKISETGFLNDELVFQIRMFKME